MPLFGPRGSLPPGVHETTMAEIESRLAFNEHRRHLVAGLKRAVANLEAAGARRVWIDGSFVTDKPEPADIDGCWDPVGVNPELLDPILLDFRNFRVAMKREYGVDFFPNVIEAASGRVFYRFFQYDRDQEPRGLLLLNLGGDQ